MAFPDYESARRYVLHRLETELPSNLLYHCVAHTRDEVLPAVDRLAAMENVNGNSLILLRTAALFHDLGYIERDEGHEAVGAGIADQVLPGFGYTSDQVRVIHDLITATRLPRTPQSRLEEILEDADLDTMGRPDFMSRGQDLRKEWESLGRFYTDEEWDRRQLDFLREHSYFTASARTLWETRRQQNTKELRAALGV